MSLAATAMNVVVFGFVSPTSELLTFLGTILGISVIVMSVLDFFTRRLSVLSHQPAPIKRAPPLHDRLAYDKRGALVALTVEDHYVSAQTDKGEDMALMRLADAMREVEETRGTQVHRSHWAAFDQVVKVMKHGDRATLYMTTGAEIPVSRSNMPKLKDAGLIT